MTNEDLAQALEPTEITAENMKKLTENSLKFLKEQRKKDLIGSIKDSAARGCYFLRETLTQEEKDFLKYRGFIIEKCTNTMRTEAHVIRWG